MAEVSDVGRTRSGGFRPMNLRSRCAIAVMAKAPQPGRCKTRLVGALSAEDAAALSGAFLRDITENIRAAAARAPVDGFVAYAPSGLEALFAGHLAAGTRLVLADGTGEMPAEVTGFGRCLLHAIRSLLAMGYGAACVLNSDSPTLPNAALVDAARCLLEVGAPAVLGPADDGGYYLLGMRAEQPGLFAGIAWSTERVAGQTRARATSLGLAMPELAVWYDVDDRAALLRLIAELDAGAAAAPATAACLARIGARRRLGIAA
jgi:rSAM/selenodomain-associated transferase 1